MGSEPTSKALPVAWPLPGHAPSEVHILVVDDQDLVRVELVRILERHGFQCSQAADGRAALEILDRLPVDLVLADIKMPVMGGLALVKALADRIPDVAVVMVSSMDSAEIAMECLRQGAYGYVLKPFKSNDILIAVANGLRRRMLELEFRDREQLLARRVLEQTLLLRASREEVALRLISASEHRDSETGAHVRRIGLFAAEMGRLLDWGDERVESLKAAAPMHDIGKIGVPDRILQKGSALTEDEWGIMKTHTSMGATILRDSSVPFIQMGACIARCHHEKWDGSGYPAGLRGPDIPVEARITCLVDVYDALLHRRVYKRPWPEEEVLAYLHTQGGQLFDPQLVDRFFEHYLRFRDIQVRNPDQLAPDALPERDGKVVGHVEG